jgi:hypothetical protein
LIPNPTINLEVPDMILGPWFQGSGNSVAVDFADSLVINGYWDIPDTASFDPLDTTRLNWSAHALRMLGSKWISSSKVQSNCSPCLPWGINVKP